MKAFAVERHGDSDAVRPADVHQWGLRQPADLPAITGPVLIVHGESDRMVPAANATDLCRHLPGAAVTVYPDAGHRVVCQYDREYANTARESLALARSTTHSSCR